MAGRLMLRFAAIGVFGVLAAAASAQAVIALGQNAADHALRPAEVIADEAAVSGPGGSAAQVVKSPDGHYWADANVNGRAVRLLVDTGATAVALTADDARRLGFRPESLDYAYSVTTANGPARAAKVTLASVSVSGAEISNVDALVIDKGLQTSLLGMTYLGRLSQFEATPTAMILRP
jgi:aspartyl protease family protein